MANDNEPFLKPGGRNLLLLCLVGIVMALASTSISLIIYRSTGDIYLDRSRPGYISEDEVHDAADDGKESFSSDGEITKDVLDGYAKDINEIYQRLETAKDAFSDKALSAEMLGIDE
jgi:hypothetical protein